jgi:hypothetical protein
MADNFLDIVWRAELSYFHLGKACDYHSIIEILHFRRVDGSEHFDVRETLWTRTGVTDEATNLAECADRKAAIIWAANYLKKMVVEFPFDS